MRKMRKFLNILFLCTLALGLSSCEPDDGEDYYIYDTLLGGIWVGDLGFADAYNSPLESGLYFEGNGLGRDEQAYYNDPYGEVAFSLPFRWLGHPRQDSAAGLRLQLSFAGNLRRICCGRQTVRRIIRGRAHGWACHAGKAILRIWMSGHPENRQVRVLKHS